MALLRSHDEDEYRAHGSTLAVSDSGGYAREEGVDPLQHRPPESPYDLNYDCPRAGTYASTGYGWLEAKTGGGSYHRVRLEAHDQAPTQDAADWEVIAERPYGATTGWVQLGDLESDDEPCLRLGPPQLYRVRIHRRPAEDDGDLWLLQFWPAPDPAPPVVLRRATDLNPWGTPGYTAEDVVTLARWSPGGILTAPVREIAARLLLPVELVTAALSVPGNAYYGGPALHVVGERGDPAAVLAITPHALPEEETDDWAAGLGVPLTPYVLAPGQTWHGTPEPDPQPRQVRRRGTSPLPTGPPPAAGYVGADHVVVVVRDGELAELARLPWRRDEPAVALQSAYGVVATPAFGGVPVLLNQAGEANDIGPETKRVALDPTGRYLALHEAHLGRRWWVRLHLVDLADGSRQTREYGEEDRLELVCILDGGICYDADLIPQSLLWVPGSEPVPLPHRVSAVDPLTGNRLVREKVDGPLHLWDRTGKMHRLGAGYGALAPGAARFATLNNRPRAVKMWAPPTAATPTLLKMPARAQIRQEGPWEDAVHLLLQLILDPEDRWATPVRLDTDTGQFERVTVDRPAQDGELTFIRPLHLP